MKTETKPVQIINLLELSNQIATTAISLHHKVEETGKPVIVQASSLLKKLPELATLPPTIPLFRVRKGGGDVYEADTLCVYLSEAGQPTVFAPDLEPLTGFTIQSWKSGISGYCEIVHESGIVLRCPISVSESHLNELVTLKTQGLEGEGIPPANYIRPVPQPEIPIYSDVLPAQIELEITKLGGKSRKHESQLVDVKSPSGEIFKNVICNASLERIATSYGVGAKFKIVGKRPRLNKNGEPINSEGKVDRKNPSQIVVIANLQGIDFGDLEI